MLESLKASDYIQIVVFVIGGFGFVWTMKAEIKMLARDIVLQGQRIDNQSTKIEQLTVLLRDQAVMNERMNNFDRQMDDIRHGRGFVIASEYTSARASILDR